jgi:sec-independent protein translocase protein TatA
MLTDILQPTHLLIVLVVALVVLGPKRLPDAGRALGQGLREFRHSISPDSGGSHGQSSASGASEDPTPAP